MTDEAFERDTEQALQNALDLADALEMPQHRSDLTDDAAAVLRLAVDEIKMLRERDKLWRELRHRELRSPFDTDTPEPWPDCEREAELRKLLGVE